MPAWFPRLSRSRIAFPACLIAALACSDDPVASPERTMPAESPTSAAMAVPGGVEQFLAAQGTACTPSGGKYGDCFNLYGPGYPPDVFAWCTFDPANPVCWYSDLGVYDRWLAEALGTGVGTRWGGQVSERRLADGRRHVHVQIRGTEVLTLALRDDFPGDDPVSAEYLFLGESPHELVNSLRAPTLGTASVSFEFRLPADYVGYPDFVEFATHPRDGMELLGFRYVAEATGEMRLPLRDLAIGDNVRLRVNYPYNLELEGKLPMEATATGLRRTGFSPGFAIELMRVGR